MLEKLLSQSSSSHSCIHFQFAYTDKKQHLLVKFYKYNARKWFRHLTCSALRPKYLRLSKNLCVATSVNGLVIKY